MSCNGNGPVLLINMIEIRPDLWDPAKEDYKNKQKKKSLWLDICMTLDYDFDNKSDAEQDKICRDLQLKWRNIRDAYIRWLRTEKKLVPGAKPMKKYVYANHMKFLKKVLSEKIKVPKLETPEPKEYEILVSPKGSIDETIKDGYVEINPESDENIAIPQPSSSTIYRRKKKKLEDKFEKIIDLVNKRTLEKCQPAPSNEDLDFFKSLLPNLKKMTDYDKLRFKTDVMQLLLKYNSPQRPGEMEMNNE